MKSYAQLFAEIEKPAIIPFFVIGDPDFDTSLALVKTAIDNGADILELGIPFSDPIADGPTIQKADIRAIDNGIDMQKALKFISEVKAYKDIPIGLLMYYNLIYQYPAGKFFADFHAAGVNSVLIADLVVDDIDEISPAAKAASMDTVFMVTPNTSDERIDRILTHTTGFVYTVSLLGVTGQRDTLSDSVAPLVKKLKVRTNLPVCVGFGISTPEHAAAVASAGADGVIIGSRIIKFIEENLTDTHKMKAEIGCFLQNVKNAVRQVNS
jgi:tryptophan synthase alpha chain